MSKNAETTINRIQLKRTKTNSKIEGNTAMSLYVGEAAVAKVPDSNPMLVVCRPENAGESSESAFQPTTTTTVEGVSTVTNNWCWFLGKESKELLLNESILPVTNKTGNTADAVYLTTELNRASSANWISPAIYTTGVATAEEANTPYYIAITPDTTNNMQGKLYRDSAIYVQNGVMYGAAWNDYAESRLVETKAIPGECVVEFGNGTMVRSSGYLQPAGSIISDTFGHIIGPRSDHYKPIAVTGRVLAYVDESKGKLEVGDAVMTAPNGKVAKMTRRQIKKYPDRIVGIVSEFPTYEVWNKKVEVKGRVWIRVR